MESILWNLFKKTGDIKYYLLLERVRNEYEGDSRRDNNRGNKLQ